MRENRTKKNKGKSSPVYSTVIDSMNTNIELSSYRASAKMGASEKVEPKSYSANCESIETKSSIYQKKKTRNLPLRYTG